MENAAIDLMNSDWRDYRGSGRRADRLDDVAWVQEFLGRWELGGAGAPTRAQLAGVKALRAAMFAIVDALEAGRDVATQDLGVVNEALAASPARAELVRDGGAFRIERAPARRDWNWVRSELAGSFAGLLVRNDPGRLRRCENEDCRWVFYDESKSRSRRWCADVCGNLIKVRRFRARARRG